MDAIGCNEAMCIEARQAGAKGILKEFEGSDCVVEEALELAFLKAAWIMNGMVRT